MAAKHMRQDSAAYGAVQMNAPSTVRGGEQVDTPLPAGTQRFGQGGQNADQQFGRASAEDAVIGYQTSLGKKPRHRSALVVVGNALIALGVLLMLVAGGMWGYSRYRYWAQGKVNQELATHVTVHEVSDVSPDAADAVQCPIEVDWASLKAVNGDVVGWINVPGTVVNYPVYQGKDNDEYLRTNALGEYSVGGQVFLDWENVSPGMVDQQSILYGHHLWDGTMFQPLSLLDDQTVFDATETIWYVTEDRAYELQPLLMYYATPDDETVRQFHFDSDEAFREYLTQQLSRAVTRRQDADQLIAQAPRVLTLSTCNYYDGFGRSILVTVEKDPAATA